VNEVVHSLLEQAADSFPDATAVVDRGREMTYRQLDAWPTGSRTNLLTLA
jgi:non-ribosomal peptide synthetase component F